MNEDKFEELFGAKTQARELNDRIRGQTPVGMHEEAGIVMSSTESTHIIQVWLLQQFALFGRTRMYDFQYMRATAIALGVATLQIKAISDAII